MKTFLLSSAAQVLPAQSDGAIETVMRDNNSWVVIDRSGRQFLRYQGVIAAVASVRWLAWLVPILKIAPIAAIGERVYRLVAEHRSVSCQLPTIATSSDPTAGLRLSTGASILAAAMMLYMLVWNLANVRFVNVKIPDQVRSVGNLVGLDQTWAMFAPFPAKDDGWYVIPGRLKNGRQIDLQSGGLEVNWYKPQHIAQTIKNHRWRKFFELLNKRDFLATSYAGYLCRSWNRSHSGDQSLQELEIVFMLEWTRPNFEYFEPRRISLLKHQCVASTTEAIRK